MRTVNATVDSAVRFCLRDIGTRAARSLRDALSYRNPEFEKRKRMGLWTGGTPERLTVFVADGGDAVVPRGAARDAIATLKRHGIAVSFAGGDRRVCEPCQQLAGLWPKAKAFLRDYQAEAVDAAFAGRQGVITAPCGAGKTMIGVGIIARCETAALVLVHTQDLVAQWVERIEGRLGVNAGVWGGGQCDVRPVTVAMVQTLIQADQRDVDAIAGRFGLVILDEAHHCPAETFRAIVERCPARFRIGLTATPERADGLTRVMYWTLGGPLSVIPHARLVACGALEPARVEPVFSAFEFDPEAAEGDGWNALASAVVGNDARNRLICDLVAREYEAGHVILVLSGRVEHCVALARALCARGVPAVSATGETPKGARKRAMDDVRSGVLRVLCASTIADEGLDLPNLTRIVQAFPGRSSSRAIQRLGRLMRPSPGKPTPVLFDVVDAGVPTLTSQWRARRRAYKQAMGV